MSAVWGKKVRYTIFGESHGAAIGIVIDGLPAGILLDMDAIRQDMARRAPGGELATSRSEKDEVTIQSGLYKGRTSGAPLCAVIPNTDARSSDYAVEPVVFRPGHADYSGYIKYGGYNDPRGGGHFSGRLTAPLVFAGAIAKQLLTDRGITVGAHIAAIGNIKDCPFDPIGITSAKLSRLTRDRFPVFDSDAAAQMQELIRTAKKAGDSIGGIVEAAVCGLPAGIGDPFFNSAESRLAQLLFSIPAVKAVEFGDGLGLAQMLGSQANDSLLEQDGRLSAATNHNGGIIGGITNGMPVILRAVFKPTPSIAKEQRTVNADGEAVSLVIKGRHDPCIVPRAVPVVEAAIAMAIWDMV